MAECSKEELIKALNMASKYLDRSGDLITNDLVYRTPAMGLRMAADKLEQKDSDIAYIRSVIERCSEQQSKP